MSVSSEIKVADIEGVRGGEPGCPIELWLDKITGELLVRIVTNGGYSSIDVNLIDLMNWARFGPTLNQIGFCNDPTIAARIDLRGNLPSA